MNTARTRSLRGHGVLALLLGVTLSVPALAQDKGKKGKGEGDPFADLFGDSLGGSEGLGDLTKGVKHKDSGGLKPKASAYKDKATIELQKVFAARWIKMHRSRGCVPADRNRTKIVQIDVDDLPARTPPLAVCLTIGSDAHREVRISTAIVSPKNRRIAKAESVIDFRGKPVLDHIMQFPEIEFRRTGQYFYRVEIDGELAGKMPLFTVAGERERAAAAAAAEKAKAAAEQAAAKAAEN